MSAGHFNPSRDRRAEPAQPAAASSLPKANQLRRPLPATWWLQRRSYFLFMLREFTSLFVAAYAVLWIVLAAVSSDTFRSLLTSPLSMALHLPALLMVLYHTYTWFQATQQVMPLWHGEQRVNPRWITAAQWALWLIVTLTITLAVMVVGGD